MLNFLKISIKSEIIHGKLFKNKKKKNYNYFFVDF